jgi:hypothetical protein
MSLVDRAKNILLEPESRMGGYCQGRRNRGRPVHWLCHSVVRASNNRIGDCSRVAGHRSRSLAPMGIASVGIGIAAGMAAVGFVIGLIMLYVMSLIVNAVSPSFNGKSDIVSATKLMAYASTPSWIAGLIAPFLGPVGGFVSLAAIAYVVYLIYTGIGPIMEAPADKVAGFTVVIILIYIVLSMVLTMFIGGMLIATFFGGAMMAGAASM